MNAIPSDRPTRLLLALLCIVLFAAALTGCGRTLTLEQQIIATIEEMEARIEANERRAFMQHIADDFSAQDGRMTREQVRALVVFQLQRHKQLEARLLPIRVQAEGETAARAVFRALITGGPGWLPDSGQVYEFDTRWRKEGGDWLLWAANWTPVDLEDVIPDVLQEL